MRKSEAVYRKILLALPVILWMILIFYFSAQVAEESQELSNSFMTDIFSFIIPGFKKMATSDKLAFLTLFSFAVRKTAHFLIYSVLGFLIILYISQFQYSNRIKIISAFALSFFYAVSDEIHQLFVRGRSGEVRDVLIDSVGALLGILIYVSAKKISNIRKKNQ